MGRTRPASTAQHSTVRAARRQASKAQAVNEWLHEFEKVGRIFNPAYFFAELEIQPAGGPLAIVMQPLVLLNTVGLTSRHLPRAPRLHALAQAGWQRPLLEVVPAVTCTAQASMLTGKLPQEHGIVGNGWLYRDTMEVRFWQQSNRLIEAEPVYATLRNQGHSVAKLFWWFNQGADVNLAVTPKP